MSKGLIEALAEGAAKGYGRQLARNLGPRPKEDDPRRFRLYHPHAKELIGRGARFETFVVMEVKIEDPETTHNSVRMYASIEDLKEQTNGRVAWIDE